MYAIVRSFDGRQ